MKAGRGGCHGGLFPFVTACGFHERTLSWGYRMQQSSAVGGGKLANAVSKALTDEAIDRVKIVAEFHNSHPESFHDQRVVATVIGCSEEKLERDRWAGKGIPFTRFGRLVRYRKRDVVGTPCQNSDLPTA
jgi:hypothetical protein